MKTDYEAKLEAAVNRVKEMDERDGWKNREIGTIMLALDAGLRGNDDSPAYDALVMLCDLALGTIAYPNVSVYDPKTFTSDWGPFPQPQQPPSPPTTERHPVRMFGVRESLDGHGMTVLCAPTECLPSDISADWAEVHISHDGSMYIEGPIARCGFHDERRIRCSLNSQHKGECQFHE